ncbi:YtxH-like protein [Bacillus sp. THAF10]|uniref:YtxH domain-containing protein n=1 Tax=Bacillus sp. THAF10 TaxID=2587848 RepID=UPI001268F380|nr:YtxH domain-containing protein [Bacillus sp. THAF10]QFT88263.1 YtxH-like protein [Bacillus sp. THAF10]
MNGKSFIYGVLIGGAIAGVSTLLTTPASGAEARLKVKNTKRNIQLALDEVKQEAINVKNQLTEAMEEGKATVGDLTNEVKISVDLWKNSIKPHQESIQQNIAALEKELEKLEKSIEKNTTK